MSETTLSRRDLLKLGATVSVFSATGRAAAAQAPAEAVQAPGRGEKLTTRGLFMHVWDLPDEDLDSLLGWIRDSGLNRICIAGSYHAGWFVHPHSPRRRLHLSEGGVLYFQPDPEIFGRTPIRPRVAEFVRERNWLAEVGRRVERYGIRMVSWTIGVHSTDLGKQYPQYTHHTVYGDSLPHALSIGHDATREYLKALCRNLATHYPLHGVQLESFGWMSVRHGHHHERDLTGLSALEHSLLSICFNPETVRKARRRGIDVDEVRQVVRGVLDDAFREAPDRPSGHPTRMEELEERSAELKAYNRFREELYESLIRELKQEALAGTSCKLLLQSGYRGPLAPVVDGFATAAYGQPPEEVLEIVRRATAPVPAGWNGEFPCFIRLGMAVPSSEQQLRGIVQALRDGGSTGPIFYNYSESPRKMLGWIEGALRGL